uniref:Uncharacterized protein n=1 Tax=Arundo donax TaxID=35708 RepID=A0A0A9EUJ2_ARUDO
MSGRKGGQFFSSITIPARAAASSLLFSSFSLLFNSASLACSSFSLFFKSFDESRGIATVALKSAGSGGSGDSRELDAGATFLGFGM